MLRCPKCGYSGKLYISASANVEVDGDSEIVESNDGFEWDEKSICACSHCYYESNVKAFMLFSHRQQKSYQRSHH